MSQAWISPHLHSVTQGHTGFPEAIISGSQPLPAHPDTGVGLWLTPHFIENIYGNQYTSEARLTAVSLSLSRAKRPGCRPRLRFMFLFTARASLLLLGLATSFHLPFFCFVSGGLKHVLTVPSDREVPWPLEPHPLAHVCPSPALPLQVCSPPRLLCLRTRPCMEKELPKSSSHPFPSSSNTIISHALFLITLS